MSIDAGLAALLVRATARVSAVILSASLLVAARRLGGHEKAALPVIAGARRPVSYTHLTLPTIYSV